MGVPHSFLCADISNIIFFFTVTCQKPSDRDREIYCADIVKHLATPIGKYIYMKFMTPTHLLATPIYADIHRRGLPSKTNCQIDFTKLRTLIRRER